MAGCMIVTREWHNFGVVKLVPQAHQRELENDSIQTRLQKDKVLPGDCGLSREPEEILEDPEEL